MVLRRCAKCAVFVDFQFTTYETIYLFVNPQLAGRSYRQRRYRKLFKGSWHLPWFRWVLILALAGTPRSASHQCCSAKKAVPELRLGLVLSVWLSSLLRVNFAGFPCRLATCSGPTSHPRCDFSKPQMSATHGTYRGV